MSTATIDRHAAASARDRVMRSSRRFWHPTDFDLPESTAQHLLASLVDSGELRRVRRGLYWRGAQTPLGMSPPPQDALVKELAPGQGVGLSGLSAANLLRLSTQVPKHTEYAVPRRAPANAGSVKFVSRAARQGRVKSRLNPTEVATLEVLDAWQRVIEMPPNDAMRRLADLVRKGDIRADRLAMAAATEPTPTRERLRALLEQTGNSSLAAKVMQLNASKTHRRRAKATSAATKKTGTRPKTMEKSRAATPKPAPSSVVREKR